MVFLQNFGLSAKRLSCPNIYPYNVFRGREGMVFFFEPVTVLYGNNGSGKSTLLNQIANKLNLTGKEYATPNRYGMEDYCGKFLSECTYEPGADEFGRKLKAIPYDSRYIKSEDILYEIKKIQQKSVVEECLSYGLVTDGMNPNEARGFLDSNAGRKLRENVLFAQEKYSNGETAFQLFDEFIKPDALYLLDEPEVSLSPSNQVRLAQKLNDMARLLGCQFIIATHSPFMLGTLIAKIYNLDSKDFKVSDWTELENVRYFYNFFMEHQKEFEDE